MIADNTSPTYLVQIEAKRNVGKDRQPIKEYSALSAYLSLCLWHGLPNMVAVVKASGCEVC